MSRKEAELCRLRDHFSDQLAEKTMELASASKALKQEKARLSAILTSMGEGVVEIDEDGLVRSVNPRAEALLGFPDRELIGRDAHPVFKRFSLLHQSSTVPKREPAANSGVCCDRLQASEAVLERPDGERVVVAWTYAPLTIGQERCGCVITLADISSRIEAETALKHQREDFISALKHRLKTPILASRRVVSLLLDGGYGELSAEQAAVMEALLQNSEKLTTLVNNMVEVYRYQNGMKELSIRSESVAQLTAELAEKYRRRASSKSVQLIYAAERCPQDLQMDCDRREIQTLIEQVLDNAVEHARSSVLFSVERGDGNLALVVKDDGRGINQADVKNLFDRFFEVSSEGHHPAHTGTGLTLCAEIARAHGGKIICESTPGAGATFRILLPLRTGNEVLSKHKGQAR